MVTPNSAKTAANQCGTSAKPVEVTCSRCGYTFPYTGKPSCPRCSEPVYSFCTDCRGCTFSH